jgi:hypothetical protein
LQDDEAVEIITHKAPEIPVAQETDSRKRAMARILELAKGKSLGGTTVRGELIDEGRSFVLDASIATVREHIDEGSRA